MYIQPSTEIHILQNIPLNKSYEHTVFYKDAETQATEFLKFEKYMLTNYSYQRANLGTLRVELKYENLYNCNYLMFKNDAFEKLKCQRKELLETLGLPLDITRWGIVEFTPDLYDGVLCFY